MMYTASKLIHGAAAACVIGLCPTLAFAQSVSLQDVMNNAAPLPPATVFVAKQFITMDPKKPRAEAVAVVDGKIVAVGSRAELEKLAGTQAYKIDDTFKDKIVTAGLIDQHVHPFLAALTMVTTAVISIEDWDTVTGFSSAESPSLKWSDLSYVFWHQGGPICRGSVTSLKKLSPS